MKILDYCIPLTGIDTDTGAQEVGLNLLCSRVYTCVYYLTYVSRVVVNYYFQLFSSFSYFGLFIFI